MSYNQLTEVERYQIYSLLKTGITTSGIADHLGRHPRRLAAFGLANEMIKPNQSFHYAEGQFLPSPHLTSSY